MLDDGAISKMLLVVDLIKNAPPCRQKVQRIGGREEAID
jgi:hypothetical protein